jgi:hypothetical protein
MLDAKTLNRLGARALELGQRTQALRLLTAAVDADPLFVFALYNLGSCLMTGKDPPLERALECFMRVRFPRACPLRDVPARQGAAYCAC